MPLHPQSKALIELIASQNAPAWEDLPPVKGREIFSKLKDLFGEGPELALVEDATLGGVPVRIYRPDDSKTLPCVMYFHGGGWVLGNLDTHDTLCRRLAQQSGATVIAVDYRLAPEHKYPAALDDCYNVAAYVSESAASVGVDASRMVVAGDSAGGNLAAAVCLRARDAIAKGDAAPNIALQVLIYPVVEPDYATKSYRDFAIEHGLTSKTMQWMWDQYWEEGNPVDKKYVVLTASELHGLPATHLITAEYDILRDEGEGFASKLKDAAVDVTMKRYDGMLHGFVHFSAMFDDGLTAIEDIGAAIKEQIAG